MNKDAVFLTNGTCSPQNKPGLKARGFWQGWILTMMIAFVATTLGKMPGLSIMGSLVLAILLGIGYRALFDLPAAYVPGIQFSSKKILRYGIILLGMRLSLTEIIQAGWGTLIVAILSILVGMVSVLGLARWLKMERRLSYLTAAGTSICGAAAVVAIAPQVKAKEHETAAAAATVALLGTLFTLLDLSLLPLLPWSSIERGIFLGGTLHEIAHVVAASFPFDTETQDRALIVKLTRVALLIPVALFVSILFQKFDAQESTAGQQKTSIQIPWFIFGFLGMSALATYLTIPSPVRDALVQSAYFFLAMAMAGLGLSTDLKTFRQLGVKAMFVGLIGSLILSAFDAVWVYVLRP